jgi:hypothetical protein|tara:strand:- start:4255 stop:5574 length:1320 start_codon:yes stop_codon:yes gene_type:complete
MSKIEVNEIVKASGSTLTLGGSGTAVTLGCGATQSGFGRTGTVDWQTGSIKTSTFTAVNGQGFFVDTSSSGVTTNLPAGSAGSIVAFADYASNFDSNNLTIAPNGTDKINGQNSNATVSTKGLSLTLVYVDATRGWKTVTGSDSDTTGVVPATYVAATGGTVSTVCTNFKVHVFTGPGNFIVSNAGNSSGSNAVSYEIVAGGGGGGYEGGGGAGGYRESKAPFCSYTASPIAATGGVVVSAQTYPIVVGAGGAGITSGAPTQNPGSVSSGLGISSAGGGAGGNSSTGAATSGGSGGGGRSSSPNAGGAGNTPPVTPAQGFPGGDHIPAGNPAAARNTGGGGGGATARGGGLTNVDSGYGGAGATSNITASPVALAGGGAGGVDPPSPDRTGGTGGGGDGKSGNGGAGGTNTGGGGGGSWNNTGGNGGSGKVVIRYKFQG